MEGSQPGGSSSEVGGNDKDSGSNTNSASDNPDEVADDIICMLFTTTIDMLSMHKPFESATRKPPNENDMEKVLCQNPPAVRTLPKILGGYPPLPRNSQSQEFVRDLLAKVTGHKQQNGMPDLLLINKEGRKAYSDLFEGMIDSANEEDDTSSTSRQEAERGTCSKPAKDAILMLAATIADLLTLRPFFKENRTRKGTKAKSVQEINYALDKSYMIKNRLRDKKILPLRRKSFEFVRDLLLDFRNEDIIKLMNCERGKKDFRRAAGAHGEKKSAQQVDRLPSASLNRNAPSLPNRRTSLPYPSTGPPSKYSPYSNPSMFQSSQGGVASHPSPFPSLSTNTSGQYQWEPLTTPYPPYQLSAIPSYPYNVDPSFVPSPSSLTHPSLSSLPIPYMESRTVARLRPQDPNNSSPNYASSAQMMGHTGATPYFSRTGISSPDGSGNNKRKGSDGESSEQYSAAKRRL